MSFSVSATSFFLRWAKKNEGEVPFLPLSKALSFCGRKKSLLALFGMACLCKIAARETYENLIPYTVETTTVENQQGGSGSGSNCTSNCSNGKLSSLENMFEHHGNIKKNIFSSPLLLSF